MHILIKNSNTNLLHTYRCLYARMDTHTTSAFHVSWPDKKQSNTQTVHARVQYSMGASCVNLLTFFLTSFFFLSSSFRFFSSLIWARRCFLRSSSAFKSLLSDMVSWRCFKERRGLNRNALCTVCHNLLWCHCVTWHSIEDYGLFSDPYASKNPLGVALTRTGYTWYTLVKSMGLLRKLIKCDCNVHNNMMLI